MQSLGSGYTAVVLGARGGIGSALADRLEADENCARVFRLSRNGPVSFDLTDEASVRAAAQRLREEAGEARLIFNATGVLDRHGYKPEKALAAIDPVAMAAAFAINAVGAALVLKHFHDLLPRSGKSVIATISARVGSIGDNRLGGWYSYRASKAALNQIVRTSAIEITRKRREAVCVALHPGTVATELSAPHSGERETFTPQDSAARMLDDLDTLDAADSGGFFAYDGSAVPW
ncbi:MAG: SDR family NAD(P)-dependent oxidoreductase [Beijerinckiaceae bacterium]